MNLVPLRYHRRFCIYGRNNNNLIASVALRAPTKVELFTPELPHVILDQVWTHRKYRGHGYATQLLSLAKSEAECHQWCIYCRPVAHDGGPGPNQQQLTRFYAARGFDTLCRMAPWMGHFPQSVRHATAA